MTQQQPAADPAADPNAPATDVTQQPTTDPAQPTEPATAEAEPPASPPPTEAVIPAQAAGDVRAEKLIGMTVYDTNGDKVGAVKDILFNEQGQATGVVLSVGGVLGLGAKSGRPAVERSRHPAGCRSSQGPVQQGPARGGA